MKKGLPVAPCKMLCNCYTCICDMTSYTHFNIFNRRDPRKFLNKWPQKRRRGRVSVAGTTSFFAGALSLLGRICVKSGLTIRIVPY